MKSVLQEEKECFVCGTRTGLQDHHIFRGVNRKHSEEYGLKVWLCAEHHIGDFGVHGSHGSELNNFLHEMAQKHFEKTHTRDEFRKIFGKSYL